MNSLSLSKHKIFFPKKNPWILQTELLPLSLSTKFWDCLISHSDEHTTVVKILPHILYFVPSLRVFANAMTKKTDEAEHRYPKGMFKGLLKKKGDRWVPLCFKQNSNPFM
ncbi:hypothetical protein TSUD_249530 [Trifolium subterraneum]|nr:hypothetical protein TSUD_249530 [Trifolium subterraneum]